MPKIVLAVLFSVSAPFLVSAQTGTPCNGYLSGSSPPAGYGAAWNMLSSSRELLLDARCHSDKMDLFVGTGNVNQYVYKVRYSYNAFLQQWIAVTMNGTLVQGSTDWLVGRGTSVINDPPSNFFWVGYVCQWTGAAWKCGCRDQACASNFWQLQTVIPPGGTTGGGTMGGVTGGETGKTEPAGEQLIKVSGCTGRLGNSPATAGALMGQSAVGFDATRNYAAYLSNQMYAVVSKIEGSGCTSAQRVNVVTTNDHVHNYPSVHVDSLGYVYMTYFGRDIPVGSAAPYMRKSTRPHDITAWGPEGRTRLFTYAEVKSLQLKNGNMMLLHNDALGKYDVIVPSAGSEIKYRDSAARAVIAQDPGPEANPPGCQNIPYLNRFGKAQFDEGPDGTLYVTWGWGGGYYPSERPAGLCNDIRHYSEDSHEVFFAYSTDGGITWKNRAGTKTATAVLCPTRDACWNKHTTQILFNDPAFRITSARQKSYRNIWAAPDGTIYVAYSKSGWCNSGVCNQSSPTATEPGSLRLLKFRLGAGAVSDVRVDPKEHANIAGLKKFGGALYVYAENLDENKMYEYRSADDGATWTKRVISTGVCSRLSGTVDSVLHANAVRLGWECNASGGREIYYFKRAF